MSLLAAALVSCSTGGGGGDSERSFLYVVNQFSNSVSGWVIDAGSGALTPIPGSPFGTNAGPVAIVTVPSGKFVYVACPDDGTIGAFSVDSRTGALKPIQGSPFPAVAYIKSLAVDGPGDHLFTANYYSKSLFVYAIDPATGALRRGPGYGFLYDTPYDVAVTPSGKFIYAPNCFTAVLGLAFDETRGQLSPVPGSPYTTGGVYPSGGVVDPEGRFFYTTHIYSARIDGFAIDPSTGALSPIDGSPFPMREIEGSYRLTIDPKGRFLYSANERHPNISIFSRDAVSGALTEVPGSPFRRAAEPYVYPLTVAIHPSGSFAYAPSYFEDNLHGFAVDAVSGLLTEIAGSPLPTGDSPADCVVVRVVR